MGESLKVYMEIEIKFIAQIVFEQPQTLNPKP